MNSTLFALLLIAVMGGGFYYWAKSKWGRKFFGIDEPEKEQSKEVRK